MKKIIEGIVSQGRTMGARAGYSARAQSQTNASRTDKPGKHSHGIDIGASRNTAQERFAAQRAEMEQKRKQAEIDRRNKESEQRQKKVMAMAKEESVAESLYSKTDTETLQGIHKRAHSDISNPANKKLKYSHPGFGDRINTEYEARKELKKRGIKVERPKHSAVIEDTNTEKRMKIKNVARPDDPDPTSEKSKLSKQAEIKNKIIEEKPLMSQKNFGLSDALINSVRSIIEKKDDDKLMKGGKTAVDLKPETKDKVDDGDDDDKKKSKKLDPVGKEDDDVDNDGDVDNSDKYLKNRRKAISKAMKEEVEQVDELNKSTVASYAKKAVKDVSKRSEFVGQNLHDPRAFDRVVTQHAKTEKRKAMIGKAVDKLAKEEVETVQEEMVEVSKTKNSADVVGKHSGKTVKSFGRDEHGADFYKKAMEHASDLNAKRKAMKEDVEEVEEANKKGVVKFGPYRADPKAKVDFSKDNEISAFDSPEKLKAKGVRPPKTRKFYKEEFEQVDELNKSTLASYVNKASDDATKHSYIAGKTGDVNKAGKASKRIRGVIAATKRMAKEEVSLSADELARLEEIAKKFD